MDITLISKRFMKNIIFNLVVLSLYLFVSACSPSKSKVDPSNKAAEINEIINLYASYDTLNGAILVADKGEVIYKNGLGLANMEWDIPNTVETKFQIASLTKMFTAMLVLQLVAEHKLELHEPISSYLPTYPKENGDKITIHHLLSHASGLGREPSNNEKYNQPEAMVAQFANAPLSFPPGAGFEYSNSGYTLLGYLIETITEQSYEEALQARIFKPLKMKNSGYFTNRKLIKNMASGYHKGFAEFQNTEETDESTAYAAGAIYSTIDDLFTWDQALSTEILLPKKYRDLFFEKHSVDSEEGGYYGYGWELKTKPIGTTKETIETVGHSGNIAGFRALYTRIPATNSSIIVLNNTSRSFFQSLTTAITGILNDQPYDLPLIPLAKFMLKTIEKDGIETGIQFYKQHKNSTSYYVSEQELIVAGYKFLHIGNAADAAKIFKLSTEVFPDRDNPYDSYAEALMTLGKNKDAIINYKKSLALNPKNNNAITMLAKLGVSYSTDILTTAATWGKELFAIPLHFAPDIKLQGFEDARFPKGWKNTESPEFWTYAFAWKVDSDTTFTALQIEEFVKKYYDGLLGGVNKEKDLELPPTKVKLMVSENDEFSFKTSIYDTFTTKKPLVLNVHVEQLYCKENRKAIILFRISPKGFTHKIWEALNKITINNNICD